MFVDQVKIRLKAGKGGDGIVSFRHEKYVDKGGPDGGDGGNGGDIVLVADQNLNSLSHFRRGQVITAEDGLSGGKRNKHGRSAEDTIVKVPVGTTAAQEEVVLADMTAIGQQKVAALGGKGGFGNAHFKSSRRQAPRIAEKGEPGEEIELTLELKLIANVGLVGLPNAGKSTFLSVVTDAKPKIANYPFTTLSPNLGVADIDSDSLLIADIPGLIEGASQGKGLGDEFLRHVERTQVLLHLVDISDDNYLENYKTIRAELKKYRVDLSRKSTILAASKVDAIPEAEVKARVKKLKSTARKEVAQLSSQTHENLKELLRLLSKSVKTEQAKIDKQTSTKDKKSDLPVFELEDKQRWEVRKVKDVYKITGPKIERFARRIDFEDEFGLRRIRDILHKMGIIYELRRQGAGQGSTIQIDRNRFEL